MDRIVLASQSPRRQALLRQVGLTDFSILVPNADESFDPALPPEEIVCGLSGRKAAAAAAHCGAGDLITAADTMVFLDDQRLGKPRDRADAFRMLSALSGRTHRVCTGLTVRRGDRADTRCESTLVRFRQLEPEQIRSYIATGEPMDKAGSYGIQGRGALLVESIQGDYFNVMGLPLQRLSRMLETFGLDLFAREVAL